MCAQNIPSFCWQRGRPSSGTDCGSPFPELPVARTFTWLAHRTKGRRSLLSFLCAQDVLNTGGHQPLPPTPAVGRWLPHLRHHGHFPGGMGRSLSSSMSCVPSPGSLAPAADFHSFSHRPFLHLWPWWALCSQEHGGPLHGPCTLLSLTLSLSSRW